MSYKKTVINNKIVYANWFLRQLDALWDFLYFHVLPIRTWTKIVSWKDRFVYAAERAFTGFDRRISWGPESTIKFYKRLLSDLYKHAHGWPGSLEGICDEEWKLIKEKWIPTIGEENFIEASRFAGSFTFASEEQREEFEQDCFNGWRDYILRVLNYFNEADPDTCSMVNEYENDFKWDWDKDLRVAERNGEYYYIHLAPDPNDPQTQVNQRCCDRAREIDTYQAESLKKGMAEIAKNLQYLGD